MKKFKSILAAIVTIGAVLPVSAASVDYGYCADEPAQYGASALSTTNYAVIQIPAEIAAKYAGASITGVKLLCQTYTLNDVPVNTVNAFVVEDFDNFAPVISKKLQSRVRYGTRLNLMSHIPSPEIRIFM